VITTNEILLHNDWGHTIYGGIANICLNAMTIIVDFIIKIPYVFNMHAVRIKQLSAYVRYI